MVESLERRQLYSTTLDAAGVGLIPTDLEAGARSGTVVAASGTTVYSGAYLDDANGVKDAGVVYKYDGVTGLPAGRLAKPNPAAHDYFGISVAVSSTGMVLVGAYGTNLGATNTGAAYLFAASGDLVATFANPTPAPGDSFGMSVSFAGNDRVVIGAPGDDTLASNAGAAYAFDLSGGLLATYFSPTAQSSEYFGNSVASLGDEVVVASYYDRGTALRSGKVFVFGSGDAGTVRSPRLVIDNPFPGADDHFGYAVATDGDRILVGADGDMVGGVRAGAAYLMDGRTGGLVRAYNNPNVVASDFFGRSVAVADGRVMVGAPGADTRATNGGAAYVFGADTGALTHRLYQPQAQSGANFGASVAFLGGSVAVVGAPYADTLSGTDSGAVFQYVLL